jgi:hypothetical protein
MMVDEAEESQLKCPIDFGALQLEEAHVPHRGTKGLSGLPNSVPHRCRRGANPVYPAFSRAMKLGTEARRRRV